MLLFDTQGIIIRLLRLIGDNMKTITTNDGELEIIMQYAKTYMDPPERERLGCRGIIIKDDKVLLSLEERKNVYMSPGGGVENDETLEECVARELREEAGLKVRPVKHLLRVDEYCFETLWVNNYFICEIEGECERHLTESEAYNGVKPVWVDIDKAIEIFGEYESKREDQASLYLREYTVLKSVKSGMQNVK